MGFQPPRGLIQEPQPRRRQEPGDILVQVFQRKHALFRASFTLNDFVRQASGEAYFYLVRVRIPEISREQNPADSGADHLQAAHRHHGFGLGLAALEAIAYGVGLVETCQNHAVGVYQSFSIHLQLGIILPRMGGGQVLPDRARPHGHKQRPAPGHLIEGVIYLVFQLRWNGRRQDCFPHFATGALCGR